MVLTLYDYIGLSLTAAGFLFTFYEIIRPVLKTLRNIEHDSAAIKIDTKDMHELMIRIDERTKQFPSQVHGTIELETINFGRVKISANPGSVETEYDIQFQVAVSAELVSKLWRSSPEGIKYEEKLRHPSSLVSYGGEMSRFFNMNPSWIRITLRSTDPKLCSEFIQSVVRWIDRDYLREKEEQLKQFEDIHLGAMPPHDDDKQHMR